MKLAGALLAGSATLLSSCAVLADEPGASFGGTDPQAGNGSASGTWVAVAPSPLSPRTSPVGVWTGEEFLVAGGVDWVCPPRADCRGPDEGEVLLDGAAYDPATDTWRDLPDMPRGTFNDRAHWTGEEMLVVHSQFYLDGQAGPGVLPTAVTALDPVAGTWRTLSPPPDEGFNYSLWTGSRLVIWAGDVEVGDAIQALDPTTGEWSQLPQDPLGPSFDRSLVWLDGRYYLAALSKDDDREPPHFVMTSLDPDSGTWTEPRPTEVSFWAQEWWAFDSHVVNASQQLLTRRGAEPISGAMDVVTGRWAEVAQVDDYAEMEAGCQLPSIGSAGEWLAPGGSALISIDPARAIVVPPCPELPVPAVGAWLDGDLLVWGGVDASGEANTSTGLRWTPPSP